MLQSPAMGYMTPNKVNRKLLQKMYEAGTSGTEIARVFGCAPQRVYQLARKMGLTRPAGYKPGFGTESTSVSRFKRSNCA